MNIALTPSIWTSRAGPWWRLPRWMEFFTDGKLQQDTNGKVRAKSSGKIWTNPSSISPCCCGCTYCSGSTPDEITLTFTGVTICSCIDGGGRSIATTGSIDGQWTLTRNIASTGYCIWRYIETNSPSMTVTYYSSTGCTGSVTATTDQFIVQAQLYSATRLFVEVRPDISTSLYDVTQAFGANVNIAGDCCTPVTGVANAFTSCSYTSPSAKIGYGGTVDIDLDCGGI